MTSALINNVVHGWMESVMADPTSIRRNCADVMLKKALEAALNNYSRKKDYCFSVACGEFLEDDGEYYAVAVQPKSTKHRKEITQWDAVLRVASGSARRIPKNTYEWRALRLALYPELNLTIEGEDDE